MVKRRKLYRFESQRSKVSPEKNVINFAISQSRGARSQPALNAQPQAPTQSLQPAAAVPSSKLGTLTPSRFHWSHAIIAIGVLAISGAGTAVVFKLYLKTVKMILQRKQTENQHWMKKLRPPQKLQQRQHLMWHVLARRCWYRQQKRKKYFGELLNLLDVQVQKMKSMSNSIRKLEGVSWCMVSCKGHGCI